MSFFISPKYLLLIVSGGFERKCVHYGILTQKCFYSELKHQFSLSEHLKTFYAVFYIFRGRFKCFVFVQPWNFPPMEEVIFPLYLNGIAHNPIKISWFEQFQKDQLVLTTSAEESVLGCSYIQAQFVSWPHLPSPLGWPMSAMIY